MRFFLRTCAAQLLLGTVLVASPQDDNTDPLLGNYVLGASDEVVLLWSTVAGSDSASQRIFDYVGIPFQDGVLEAKPRHNETGATAAAEGRPVDVITGDLTGDTYDDLVMATAVTRFCQRPGNRWTCTCRTTRWL